MPFQTWRGGEGAPRRAWFRRPKSSAKSKKVEKLGGRYLLLGQRLYPRFLAELDNAPPILTVKG